MHYHTHGLTLNSDMHLPELGPFHPTQAADRDVVRVSVGTIPSSARSDLPRHGPHLWAAPGRMLLEVTGLASFLICEGHHIQVDVAPQADMEIVRHQLLGAVMAALMYQRGLLVLHGSAIRIADRCLVCIGPSGAGKSTLAAGFQRRGYQVLADDMAPIDHTNHTMPGRRQILLRPDAVHRFGLRTIAARRVGPGVVKYALPARRDDVCLPIGWILAIEPGAAPDIETTLVDGVRQFELLKRHSFRPRFVKALGFEARQMMLCGRVAASAPIAHMRRPQQGSCVDGIIDRILSDLILGG